MDSRPDSIDLLENDLNILCSFGFISPCINSLIDNTSGNSNTFETNKDQSTHSNGSGSARRDSLMSDDDITSVSTIVEYQFNQTLLRDAAYDSILYTLRRDLHLHIARHYEKM